MRGYMCREFLRDAVKRMNGKLASVNEDESIQMIMKQTREYIESLGEHTEAERAYVVARNLIIIAGNIEQQKKRGIKPGFSKQPVQLRQYHIGNHGIKEFAEIIGITIEKELKKCLNPKLPPMTAKQYCETRYRHMFFNTVIKAISEKEMIGGKEE